MTEPIELVAQAKNLDEVVAATGQYLARWSPESLALIPRRCRPHWIGSAEDIEMYAGQLQTECERSEVAGTPLSNELELMRDFFAGALSRCSGKKSLTTKANPNSHGRALRSASGGVSAAG